MKRLNFSNNNIRITLESNIETIYIYKLIKVPNYKSTTTNKKKG